MSADDARQELSELLAVLADEVAENAYCSCGQPQPCCGAVGNILMLRADMQNRAASATAELDRWIDVRWTHERRNGGAAPPVGGRRRGR